MPDLLHAPLQELSADLRRLQEVVGLLQAIRVFGAVESSLPPSNDTFDAAARQLRDSIRGLSADLPVLSGTLLLYLAGRFEHFVKMSLQATCDAMAAKCQSFSELPEKIRENLREFTAEVARSPNRYGFDNVQALGFLVALAGNVNATGGLGVVNSECLALTQNNMTPGVLADLYKPINMTNLWADLGKQAPLKTHLETAVDADAEKGAKARLEELMSIRNQIAHPNGSPTFPDPDSVRAYIDFITVLSETLTAVSRVHVTAFQPLLT